jgi:hypothetical protein
MPPKSKIGYLPETDPVPVETTPEYLELQMEVESLHDKILNLREVAKFAHNNDQEAIDVLTKQVSDLEDETKNLKLLLLRTVEERDEALSNVGELKKKQEAGKHDKTIHIAGVPYKIWHQNVAKEFFEDIKKRIVPEETICVALVKA